MRLHRLFITLLLVSLVAEGALADDVIKVCGQNVQNFFYSLDRTRTTNNSINLSNYSDEAGRTAKLNAIVSALSPYQADIYAFNEVECCAEILELLAQRMSEVTGKTYLVGETYNSNIIFALLNWNTLNSGMYYPWLYEYNDEPTGISTIANFSHPATTRKVIENGRISIIMPNGCSYTLQGIRKQ